MMRNKDYTVVDDLRLSVWLIEMAELIDAEVEDNISRRVLLNKLRDIKEVVRE